ncbi:MAG: hypothetical protein DRQ48_07150 [Gammaproteobacteria bacterium]|nr:MAG: hypothetical protein DRQ58_07265 [Gammaproteobacteria bacterium]RKZ69909.1 MAG: hypothetical protein DRQ48_07150 [Gammaproteobacteria bacterium]
MQHMKNKQYGIGFQGWTAILAVMVCFLLFGLRAFPLYNEKLTVISNMDAIAARPNADKMSVRDIRKFFLRNMEIANTTRFTDQSVKKLATVITDKKTKKRYLRVAFEARNNLAKDLNLLLVFDHKVQLGGSKDE